MNINDDRFYILSRRDSIKLLKCYTGKSNVNFMGCNILTDTFNSYDKYNLFEERDAAGVGVNFWSLKDKDVSFNNLICIMQLIMSLHTAHKLIKRGLPYTIDYLRKNFIRVRRKALDIPSLIKYLNAATLLYPSKTKCLEWSVAFFYHIIQYGYQPTLKIGVQNRPFYSHAWVEIDDEIIGDIKDLNERMVVIYQINWDVMKLCSR
ncbi:lasso peptide biosynthesis B2 protein [Enterobacter sichuanensis]